MTRTVLPVNYGPEMSGARLIVIHSVESDIKPGLGYSLATGWWRNPSNRSSVHGISDPSEAVLMVPDNQRAWHCGAGNGISWGFEHVGRAAYTTEQWLSNDGLQSLRYSAQETAKFARKFGIPAKWLSLNEIKNGARGFCTHNDMRLVFGGTTHTDPGPGFPYALYMQLVQQYLGEPVSDNKPTETTKPDPSIPQQGGAQELEEENMIRILSIAGSDTIWVADLGSHTKWAISNPDELNWLKAVGVKTLEGTQAPWTIANYEDVTSAKK